MANVAMLLPQEEMCVLAAPMVSEFRNISMMCLDYAETQQVVERAQKLVQQGCELIIARGVQAQLIKLNTSVPVVEIQITTQELGMVIRDLRRELGETMPKIALICFKNMIGDVSHFNELFDIELHTYFGDSSADFPACFKQALADGCLAVIGGRIVCALAGDIKLPCRFLPAGKESLRNGLETASRVCYAIDQKKHSLSEMDAMLNNTFSGIVRIDLDGVIRQVNRMGCILLDQSVEKLLGNKAEKIIPELGKKTIEDVLSAGEEADAIVINIRNRTILANIAPIRVADEIQGAVLNFHEGSRIERMDTELRRELYQRGYIAKYTFENMICQSAETRKMIETARRIAKYDAPILLTGEAGSGKGMLAQCIHKESPMQNSAFITVDCSAWSPETLDEMIFGSMYLRKDAPPCLAELAKNGTLYLSHVEELPLETQFKLLSLIRGRLLHNAMAIPAAVSIRVIASTEVDLPHRVEKGEFRRDLYYALNVLSLDIPPLRKRREDIQSWFDYYMVEFQKKYRRYIQLTSGARAFLEEYNWPGNLDQMASACERVAALSDKRRVDEVFLRKQLERVMPLMTAEAERVVVVKDPKAIEISELLTKYGGSREKVAEAMGISKTTLWRYMKKFGIEPNYKK